MPFLLTTSKIKQLKTRYWNSDARKGTLILLAIVLIGGQVLIKKVLIPFSAEWRAQSQTLRDTRNLLRRYESLMTAEKELKQDFEAMTKKIQARLPSARKESEFLTEIGNVAQDTSVHIENMNPLPFRDLGDFKELSVEIDLEANLGNLVRFLYLMRESSVVLVADRLRLQPKSERSALLKSHLMISTIFLKDE